MQRQIGRVNNVFDIGCGTGEWIRGYLSFCERATGIDANLAFLEEARRRLSDVEHRVELWHGDALDHEYFEDVGFASFGASLMYFGDSECRSILEKMAEAQNEGDWIYIRATVADPWGKHSKPRVVLIDSSRRMTDYSRRSAIERSSVSTALRS
jgi:SAM-dependent methyltransferase